MFGYKCVLGCQNTDRYDISERCRACGILKKRMLRIFHVTALKLFILYPISPLHKGENLCCTAELERSTYLSRTTKWFIIHGPHPPQETEKAVLYLR